MAESNDFMKAAAAQPDAGSWAEVRIDTSVPSIARGYDAMLGGKDNFAVDRAVKDQMVAAVPEAPRLAFENRAWLRRVVHYLVGEAGIRQIIDLGSGLPTTSSLHEFALEVAPKARVVYVDNDPMVLAHGRAILAKSADTTVITADARDVESVFTHPELTALIDLDQPFAVILASLLHHVPDGEDQELAAKIRERLHPGCYAAIANFHDPGDERAGTLEKILIQSAGSGWFRPYPQHRMYFAGLDLVEPGLCPVNEWRPTEDTPTDSPVHHLYVGGIGRCV
jgi:hypothetical protein